MSTRSADWWEAYGESVSQVPDPFAAVARRQSQKENFAGTLRDVRSKLAPQLGQRLLEVGFGTGLLLVPLSLDVREAVGVDHPACCDRIAERAASAKVTLVPGRWPLDGLGKFDRILVYSVLHYLENREAAEEFLDACVDSLASDGILLVGDVPNLDKARRFANAPGASEFQKWWETHVAEVDRANPDWVRAQKILAAAKRTAPFIDDEFVLQFLGRCRSRGLDAYVLPQPPDLPFCHSREDVLVKCPAIE